MISSLSSLFFLLLLRFLSASPLTTPSTSSLTLPPNNTTNLTSLHPIHCLSPLIPTYPINPTDCHLIIYNIILDPGQGISPSAFQSWSYAPGPGRFVLPRAGSWNYHSCIIAVSNADHTVVGSFSLEEVGFAARDVVGMCTGSTSQEGGWSVVGKAGKGFYVLVGGLVGEQAGDGDGGGGGGGGGEGATTGGVEGTVQRVPIPGEEGVDTS